MRLGGSAAYSELFHSDLTLENVRPSVPTFQMHEAADDHKKYIRHKKTGRFSKHEEAQAWTLRRPASGWGFATSCVTPA